MTNLERRRTLSLLATLPFTLLFLQACGSSEDDSEVSGDCKANGTGDATISSNHGHTLKISASDIAAGADKTYTITGTADHPHTVTVTAANFTTLASNTSVTLTSSTDSSHSHSVKLVCA